MGVDSDSDSPEGDGPAFPKFGSPMGHPGDTGSEERLS